MSPEEEEVREVYARFGLAAYGAQCLEQELIGALIYLDLLPKKRGNLETKEWEALFDSYTEEQSKRTLGKMISILEDITAIPPNLSESLSYALEKRNWLIHHYFRDRVIYFNSSEGRARMIAELDEITEIFRYADSLLEELFKPVRMKYGITDEVLAQSIAELRSKSVDKDVP